MTYKENISLQKMPSHGYGDDLYGILLEDDHRFFTENRLEGKLEIGFEELTYHLTNLGLSLQQIQVLLENHHLKPHIGVPLVMERRQFIDCLRKWGIYEEDLFEAFHPYMP